MRRIIALVSALLASALMAAEPKHAPAPAAVEYGEPRQLATLANPAITESSGIACSRRTPDVFWTHNDSGGEPRLYAFNSKGEDLGAWRVRGARARDWEDIASFQKDGQSFLLIGDIGDNQCHHKAYTLYLVPEPPVDPARRAVQAATEPAVAIEFRYEDGPHNCEAVAIDPTTMTIYLVIKVEGSECGVYSLPLRGGRGAASQVARRIASLTIPTTNAMDISPDGLRAVVLTYGDAVEFTRQPAETWARAFARPGRALRMPPRAQGESICYGPDGRALYLTSEKTPTPLLQVPAIGEKQAPTAK